MEIIAVSDTNIFIDLIEIGLIDDFFSLPWQIHTTDMVIHELKITAQKNIVVEYKNSGSLHVKMYDAKDMVALARFYSLKSATTKVSIQDCSVWLYAQGEGYTLLTGDAKLKNAALKSGVDVHGILYVIDKLVEHHLLSKINASKKLEELYMLNPRLPKTEIDRRIKLWREDINEKCL